MKKIILILFLLLFPSPIQAKSAAYDVTTMSIAEIQEAVEAGVINYEMLTEIYLERIAFYNDSYNAVSFINKDAVDQARKLDLEYQKTGRRSSLHGIPVIVKDNIDVVGFPTNASSRVLVSNYPKKNAVIVQKLLDAGAIVIAKGRMHEFALSSLNSYNSYGNVYNALDKNYTPYGSSGGVTVSVALSFATFGIGTDTNSSIRTPASAANLIGLRPTMGSINMDGIVPYDKERDIAGPITKYATDAAIVMSIISDKKYDNVIVEKDLSKYKFGFLKELYDDTSTSEEIFIGKTDPKITALMNDLFDKFRGYGADVKVLSDFYNQAMFQIPKSTTTGILFCYDFNQYIKGTTGPISSYSDMLKENSYISNLEYYNDMCDTDYRNTDEYKEKIIRKETFKNYIINYMKKNEIDFLIYPTTKAQIPLISEVEVTSSLSPLIAPVTGMPAINLQLGFIDKLPYGFEIIGLDNSEDDLLKISLFYDTKNNSYKGVEDAPKLYEINDDIKELLEFHTKYQNNPLYKNLTKKSSEALLNMNDGSEVGLLLNEYKTFSPPVLDIMIEKFKTDYFIIISLFIAMILVILIAYNYLKLSTARKKIINKKT